MFYLVESNEIESFGQKYLSAENKEAETTPAGMEVRANFIGTDYNFAHSGAIRTKFIENCPAEDSNFVESLSKFFR